MGINFWQKLIIVLLIIGWLANPFPAKAIWGILDVSLDPGMIGRAVWEWARTKALEEVKKTAVETLNNTINDFADDLGDDLVSWVKGEKGGQGGGIVIDWRRHLQNAGNEAVGAFAENAGLEFLCSPIRFQVQLTLFPTGREFRDENRCTMTDIEGNLNDFYADFRNGGWIAYQESMKPQNNYYLSVLNNWFEEEKKESEARTAAQNEALAGGGILPLKKNCDANGENCEVTTPGGILGRAVEQSMVDIPVAKMLARGTNNILSRVLHAAVNRLTQAAVGGVLNVVRPAPDDSTANLSAQAQAALSASQAADSAIAAQNQASLTENQAQGQAAEEQQQSAEEESSDSGSFSLSALSEGTDRAKTALKNQINNALTKRQQAKNWYEATLNVLGTCPAHPEITQIQNEKNNNDAAIVELNNTSASIDGTDDLDELGELAIGIQSYITESQPVKDRAQTLNDAATSPSFNCGTLPPNPES